MISPWSIFSDFDFEEYEVAQRLYAAQKEAYYPGMDYEDVLKIATPDFQTIEEIQSYARSVQHSEYVAQHFPKFAAFPDIRVSIGFDMPMGNSGRTAMHDLSIELRHDSMSFQKWVTLHEMSHAINAVENGTFAPNEGMLGIWINEDGHGPKFAGIFLALVKEFVPADFPRVKKAFDYHNVAITEAP